MTLGHTMENYKKENLMHDVITGIIIMAVSIPISMGYSQIAGLPAVYGLYGSVFPIYRRRHRWRRTYRCWSLRLSAGTD